MSDQNPNPGAQENTPEMSQALEFLTRPVRQTMRVEVFERDFLPFFDLRGIEKEVVREMLDDMEKRTGLRQTERDLVGNMMGRWLATVRSAYLPTDVVNEAGDVVFVVPAIMRSQDDIIAMSGEKLAQLVETASNHYNVMPSEGNKFFEQRILPFVIKHDVTIEELQQWNIIFDYYGLPRYTIPGEEVVTNEQGIAETPVDTDSECDYEL